MAGSIVSAVAAPLIGGAVSSIFGGGSNSNGSKAAAAADPVAGTRAGYQQQLQQLMTDPNAFQMSAEAQATESQGMDAMSAKMAARGLSNSGAEKTALTQYATTAAGNEYQQQISDLMTLGGYQSASPAAAAQAITQGSSTTDNALGTLGSTVGNAVTGTSAFKSFANSLSPASGAASISSGTVDSAAALSDMATWDF